jgi:hypothetical protein
MATPSKTGGTVLLSHQAVTHPDTIVGDAQDVSTKFKVRVYCYHSSVEAAANTNPGSFLIMTSPVASGDEDWAIEVKFDAQVSTADTEALSGSESAGATVLEVASTTGFVAGDNLYIQDTGTVADGEWNRCQEIVTNTSINLIFGLTNAKDSADVVWNDAEVFTADIDVADAIRLRVVFQHEGAAGVNVHVKAFMVTLDSIS